MEYGVSGSNEADAPKLIDGDPATYWQPEAADQLVDWSVDIDLGRPVLAREIELTFPDETGARPLRQFSVFITQGARIQAQDDVFRYRKIFQTTKPNVETSIAIPLLGSALDTTRVLDADRDVDLNAEQDFQMVRLIRITADEKSSDAALAEIEVLSQGDNVSLGTLERGGRFEHGLLAREPQNMFDGNMDTFGNILTSGGTKGGWREGGLWWQVDLGALFWIDEMFIYFKTRGEGTSSFLFEGLHHGRGYNILFSDGRLTTGGDLDLTFLLREDIAIDAALASARQVRHIRYLFQPRKIRYIFWHGHEDQGWFSHPNGIYALFAGLSGAGDVALGFYRSRPTRWRWPRQGHQALALGGDNARSDAVSGALAVGQRSARAIHVLRQKGRGSHRDALQ